MHVFPCSAVTPAFTSLQAARLSTQGGFLSIIFSGFDVTHMVECHTRGDEPGIKLYPINRTAN